MIQTALEVSIFTRKSSKYFLCFSRKLFLAGQSIQNILIGLNLENFAQNTFNLYSYFFVQAQES